MNYLKIYLKIIKSARNRINSSDVYYEKHHVFPISIFGKNDRIVLLTAKEHYIVHFLLWKECKKRYGIFHYKTKKMHFAFNQMTWKCSENRYTSKTFEIARSVNKIYFSGENNPSKKIEVRSKISMSKKGKERLDLKGKKYFGASEENIKAGIEKMRKKKTGMKTNYPKNRKSSKCSEEKKKNISKSRIKTKENYKNMTEEQFNNWIENQNLYDKNNNKNTNVTRVLTYRNIPHEKYYR